MAKHAKSFSRPSEKEGEILFWIKLLVFFLALNITFYGLELATRLSGCALPPPPRPITTRTEQVRTDQTRTVKVLAVADGWYRAAHPRWQETITKNVAKASHLYQHEFGIALDLVDTRAWDEPGALTIPGELAALKRAYPITYDYEVVMGFTAGSGLLVAGISEILGNHLLVAATPFHSTAELLAHELGHIFGARDTFATSATQLFLGPLSPSLLPEGFRVAIRKHKWRLFRLPPAGAKS